MGAACYVVLEKEIPGLDTMVDGKALNSATDALEKAAEAMKVRPLMGFFSAGAEEAAEFLGDGAEGLANLPPKQFHDAAEGLKTVRALIEHCTKNPGNLKKADGILEDLRGFERVLTAAQRAGVRWHLAIDV
jgi:hypothetical protein